MATDEKLRALLACAYEYSPAIRQRFDDAGLRPEDVQLSLIHI